MKDNRRGFTLIELIITIAILSIVIAIGSSFLIFGNKTFAKGEEQFNAQSDIRTAMEFIKSEVRNSSEIKIITLAEVPGSDDGYSYLYVEGGTLKYRSTSTGFTPVSKSNTALTTINPVFSISESNKKYLIDIQLADNIYQTESKILLKNIKIAIVNSGNAIKYKK